MMLARVSSLGTPMKDIIDFIDSKRDTYPSGQLLFEWYLPEKGAAHRLNFYYGLTSREGEPALLFFWIFFDSATLLRPDGSLLPISAFVSVAN